MPRMRCKQEVFCLGCNKWHRCIYKPHAVGSTHHWDSRSGLHAYTWAGGERKQKRKKGVRRGR